MDKVQKHNSFNALVDNGTQLKAKVKLSVCVIKHNAMNMYWGVKVQLHTFLPSALNGGQLHSQAT
jgi:hypothetical protein